MVQLVYTGPTGITLGDYVLGLSDSATKEAWVNGEKPNMGLVMHTIAHEIGHLIVGPGHPDENSGPAPLDPTNLTAHKKRLMCSGLNWNEANPGIQLLKSEWDWAETILQASFD